MIHRCRQTVSAHIDDPEFVFCKVDLANAFNNVALHPASAHNATLFQDIPGNRINLDGEFDILGSPVGSTDHCTNFLYTKALLPAQATLQAIKKVEDPQVAVTLIRQCSGFCQLVFSMRTTPPSGNIEPLQKPR